MKKTIGIIAAFLTLAGCTTRMGEIDTDVIVTGGVVTTIGEGLLDTVFSADWKFYGVAGDSLLYPIDSIADATALEHEFTGENNADGIVYKRLASRSAILWGIRSVRDTVKMVAWRQVDLVDGLDRLYTKLVVDPEKLSSTYEKWHLLYPKGTVDPQRDTTLTLKVFYEMTEGGVKQTSNDWKPFYSDTTKYPVPSYKDALAGQLTGTIKGQSAEVNTANQQVIFKISYDPKEQTQVFLWIAHPLVENRVAWRLLDLIEYNKEEDNSIVFQPWKGDDYVDGEWTFVFDKEDAPAE